MHNKYSFRLLLSALATACGADGTLAPDSFGDVTDPSAPTAQQASAGSGDAARAATQNAIPALERDLQTLQVSGVSVLFTEIASTPEDAFIGIRESGSLAVQDGIIARLIGEHGELSSLEIFYALAPAEVAPHPRLVELHAKEAAALGRPGDAVERFDFDNSVVVDKISPDQCTFWIFTFSNLGAGSWKQIGSNDNMSGFASTCLNNSPVYFTTKFVVAGICNDSNVTIQERNAWDYDNDPWNVTEWRNVGVNSWARWWIPATSSPKRYCADGLSPAGKSYHGRAGVFHAQ